MSSRSFYAAPIVDFITASADAVVGQLTQKITQNLTHQATTAWLYQIRLLQGVLKDFDQGYIFFEFLIPRMGRRADVVLVIAGVIFVVEFKVGAKHHDAMSMRQAEGYALDLANFHEPSHKKIICPLLLATHAPNGKLVITQQYENSANVLHPNAVNAAGLIPAISAVLSIYNLEPPIDPIEWMQGRYKATPTIIEAAQALYAAHDVEEISRSSAEAINIAQTSARIERIILDAKTNHKKSICFVTGVPGAGKTLVGLNLASHHQDTDSENAAVFLSGNGPLVTILKEVLAKDAAQKNKKSIEMSRRQVESLIQNVHRFRDQYLSEINAPANKIVIFDEAQRAWNAKKTIKFMQQKRSRFDFTQSEPDYLVSVMDRHQDWCVVIALIGGGQEVNDGEAGLNGWFEAFERRYADWNIYYSDKLSQAEYVGNDVANLFKERRNTFSEPSLHLAISMRSFRAEKVSHFVHYVVHNDAEKARETYADFHEAYPMKVTRSLSAAKAWIKDRQRGTEAVGIVASSGAKRMRAEGITISNETDPIHWFLNGQDDVRSSNYLEEAGSEFLVQGLELDWVLVAWDADFRYQHEQFESWHFKGTKWQSVKKSSDQTFLMNSYRVLLTRARQGMVIFVPQGNTDDPTRLPQYFDETYHYLIQCGLQRI